MTSAPPSKTTQSRGDLRIAMVGGGVIGLSAALALKNAGADVVVYDAEAQAGKGASDAAAGMLAPAYEAAADGSVHPKLFDLCAASAAAWPDFAKGLEAATGIDPGLGDVGALACAVTPQDESELLHLAAACARRGVPAELLTAQEARRREPALSPDIVGALHLPSDTQVDNRAVLRALQLALLQRDVPIRTRARIDRLENVGGAWKTWDGEIFDAVVFATGAGARGVLTLNGRRVRLAPEGAIQPVKGQMLSVAPSRGTPRRVLRFGAGYIAPKLDRIVIGATSEWDVDNRTVEPDAIDALRARAAQICPGLGSAEISSSWAGVRPGTRDHAPLIGWSDHAGIYLAAGHYRNGVLLAPETARIVCADILGGGADGAADFRPVGRAEASAAAAP